MEISSPNADLPVRFPAGRWAVAASGGADSTALLSLATRRPNLHLHVVHLDHELRGAESTGDADFVRGLATQFSMPATVLSLSELRKNYNEGAGAGHVLSGHFGDQTQSANPSARYRAFRLALYGQVIRDHRLDGVLLGHHALDQAETLLFRLLRGAGMSALAGMEWQTSVGRLKIVRPLLRCMPAALRGFLQQRDQSWREDRSNESGQYARNRLRSVMAQDQALIPLLLDLAQACAATRDWVKRQAPVLQNAFLCATINSLPDVLAKSAIADWLMRAGVMADALSSKHIDAMLSMCRDVTSPSQRTFPTGLKVARRNRQIQLVR